MAEKYRLDTPEALAISYDLAGIGTRFLAAIVDSLVLLALEILVLLGCLGLFLTGNIGRQAAIILALTLTFLLLWGYFTLFESLWSGQTPGKRLLKIRVIKRSGYPIDFVDAVIRNLVRVVDFLPTSYAIGLVTMFISREARRLGDYAAGTIVVKERPAVKLRDLQPTGGERAAWMPAASRGQIDPDELEWDLRAISDQDVQLVQDFLRREDSLQPAARERIAAALATRVAERIGARPPLDAARFLQRALQLRSEEDS